MGVLRVISKHGDDCVQWNELDVQSGDAEAMAAIREAERIFAQEHARGATAWLVDERGYDRLCVIRDRRGSFLSLVLATCP